MLIEEINQRGKSNGAMAYLGFLRQGHFRKSAVLAVGNKHRVIPKAAGTAFLMDNRPLSAALKCIVFISKA
ncbi:hypothetical protein D3C86_2215840 [compost metagenome]